MATLAGCTSLAQEPGDDGDEPSDTRTIAVRKTGDVEAPPDKAVLDLAVEARGDSASAVRDDLSSRSADLRDALLEYGIPEADISTEEFRIYQRMDRRAMEEDGVRPNAEADLEKYRFYEGTKSLTVDVQNVDETGDVIDVAVEAGADNVGRILFTLSEETREQLREEAIATAVEDARSEAEYTAAEVGMSVVDARRVDTAGGGVEPVREEYEMAGDGAATPTASPPEQTELQPDDVTVRATVEIVYEME